VLREAHPVDYSPPLGDKAHDLFTQDVMGTCLVRAAMNPGGG
jgi:hypothetical protein